MSSSPPDPGLPRSPLPRHWWSSLLHAWTWRMAWRDSRSQRKRLVLFSLSIVAGIGALVAIHSLRASLQAGVDTQAKALLGSDMHIASREPFSDEMVAQVAQEAQAVCRELEFTSMLLFPSAKSARMVQVRGLDGAFPFYGKVETTPPGAWERIQSESGIVLERALLDQFGVKVGDVVRLGALDLPILGALEKSPPRTSKFGGWAPEAYVRLQELPKTKLLGDSRIAFHHLHIKITNGPAAAAIRRQFSDPRLRYETPRNRREALGNALDNAEEFLGLIAIAALVLGAIGVAGAIHAHVSRRVVTVAILRCLGCPGELAFGIYLAQAIALGSIAALIGAVVGVALHLGVIAWYKDALPFVLEATPMWSVVAQTTAGGLVVCGVFALLPLLRVREIAPGAALRESAAPLVSRRLWPLYLVLLLIVTTLAVLGHTNRIRALNFTAGLAATFAILALVAKGLTIAARRAVRPRWPYLLRQGISNLYRPHNQTLMFLLSLGLGTFLLLTVVLARNALLQRLQVKSIAASPSIYLIDVQPDQVGDVADLLKAHHLPVLETAPLVTMRLKSIRGVPVQELMDRSHGVERATPPPRLWRRGGEQKPGVIPRWVLQREYRSSYREQLAPTEKLVAGEWFTGPYDGQGPAPISLEKEIAKDLQVKVGDEILLDVQGIPILAKVSSIREVDWSTFALNFFMVFPPGVLEGAPGFNVVTTRLPSGTSSGELQRVLVEKFPNVTAIDLSVILETVRSILEKVARIISLLAGFTVLAGLPILAATLLNGRDQRLRESVLLRTLGASARQVRTILVVEYATLGTLAALTGVILAVAANAALAHWVFKADPWPAPSMLLAAFSGSIALAVIGGLALSRGVSNHPPLAILRQAG